MMRDTRETKQHHSQKGSCNHILVVFSIPFRVKSRHEQEAQENEQTGWLFSETAIIFSVKSTETPAKYNHVPQRHGEQRMHFVDKPEEKDSSMSIRWLRWKGSQPTKASTKTRLQKKELFLKRRRDRHLLSRMIRRSFVWKCMFLSKDDASCKKTVSIISPS